VPEHDASPLRSPGSQGRQTSLRAILDGGNSLVHAFSGNAANVTLEGFTVRNYNTGYQGAAIQPTTTAGGWVVRDVTASGNYWAGLMATNNMQIIGGHYNSNGQLGISGNSATSIQCAIWIGAITICAMRIPRVTSKGSLPSTFGRGWLTGPRSSTSATGEPDPGPRGSCP
jgi:hypothetical protein